MHTGLPVISVNAPYYCLPHVCLKTISKKLRYFIWYKNINTYALGASKVRKMHFFVENELFSYLKASSYISKNASMYTRVDFRLAAERNFC